MDNFFNFFGGLTLVLFTLAIILLWPFLGIWAINTLFPIANIPYNFYTWLAMLLFTGIFKTSYTPKKD